MNIWFTSDHHLNHSNVIKFMNRPFSNVLEMNEALIENHNKLVKPNDTVFLLGDFAWSSTKEDQLKKLLNSFNGNKHFILGNHDKNSFYQSLCNKGLLKSVQQCLGLSLHNEYIWLSHYPHRSWNRSFHGAYHLFGHSHGTLAPYGLSFDVGVDCWDYKPICFEEVCDVMSRLTRQFGTEGTDMRWNGRQFFISLEKPGVD